MRNDMEGVKLPVNYDTNGSVKLMVNNNAYKDVYMKLRGTERKVFDAIMKFMDRDTNLIQIGGGTLKALIDETEYKEETVRKAVSALKKVYAIEGTDLRGEYIVDPCIAVKGSEEEVWKTYQQIEYRLTNRDHNGRFKDEA
jgi:hypothetical protein